MTFLLKLHSAAQQNDSWLCVGLDPDLDRLPPGLGGSVRERIAAFNRCIIQATQDLVCCYKPNFGFYEAFGIEGLQALEDTLRAVPSHVPVLADAKRGDIGNTARGYARAMFDVFGFDAVTVNPYMGGDSLEPFFAYGDRGIFVLVRTSNPGGSDVQDLRVAGDDGTLEPLYQAVTKRALSWDRGNLGLVVGATYPAELAAVRGMAPQAPILIPGVGAQAGDLEAAVQAGRDARGGGALVNASRAVLYASSSETWVEDARAAADELRQAINHARRTP